MTRDDRRPAYRPRQIALAAAPLALLLSAPAWSQLVWDRSAALQGFDSGISGATVYAPFTVAAKVYGVTATFWLDDGATGDNGVLDTFESGSLGWIVSMDDAGTPGAVVASGTDSGPVFADTGLQAVGGDQVRVTIELDGLPALAAGDYWIGIRETSPTAPDDGTEVWWAEHSVSSHYAFALYAGATTRDQSDVDLDGQFSDISNFVFANDFTLASSTRLASLSFWLTDDDVAFNDTLDGFSGVLSWAFYSNDSGAPGTLLDSGQDASPRLTAVGDHGTGGDVILAEIELREPLTIGPGTYWLALHEGAWLSAFDGTPIYWLDALSVVGNSLYSDSSPTSPGAFPTEYPGFDSAFVLHQRMIYGSGFEDGVTCAWTATVGGATCP